MLLLLQNTDNEKWEAIRTVTSSITTRNGVDLDFESESESESTVHIAGSWVFVPSFSPISSIPCINSESSAP